MSDIGNTHGSSCSPLGPDDLIMSQDRWCIYLPTKNVQFDGGVRCEDRLEWQTQGNLHLDVNPWAFAKRETDMEMLR